jgi:hypothetical protein
MPRKAAPEPYTGPPGDLRMEVRVNDKIVFLQRVHTYTIDQQTDQVVVRGALRPAATPVQELAPEPVPEPSNEASELL